MKRLLCGTVTALLISMPLFAQTSPSGSTTQPGSMDESKTTTEEVKRTTSPSGEVTEEVEKMEDTSKTPSSATPDSTSPGMQDSSMQNPSNTTTPTEN